MVDDPIQVTSIMPGLVATNIGRNVDPELLAGIVAMSGIEFEIVPGERLPDEVLVAAQAALSDIMIAPDANGISSGNANTLRAGIRMNSA